MFYYLVSTRSNAEIAQLIQVLLRPATQGTFMSGDVSVASKDHCTRPHYKVSNDSVKGQEMNWMLFCADTLQTKDKSNIYFSLFFGR